MARFIPWQQALRFFAAVAVIPLAALLLTAGPASASPERPERSEASEAKATPLRPNPQPKPEIPPGPGEVAPPCYPDYSNCQPEPDPDPCEEDPEAADCQPDPDPCEENPDAAECTPPDPCEQDPYADGCGGTPGAETPTPTHPETPTPTGTEIPTPTRIDTGAGGSATGPVAGVLIAAGLLGVGAVLARRIVTARIHGEQR